MWSSLPQYFPSQGLLHPSQDRRQRRPDLHWTEHRGFNGYIELNATAALLWETLQEPSTASDLEQVLESNYDISHQQAKEDILDFLKLLQRHDMVIIQQGDDADD